MIEKIFDVIKENFRNPKFYIVLLISIFVLLLLFPYIDANVFYYGRVERRVSILKEVAEIDPVALQSNPVLADEYESILSEISKQKDGSIGSIFVSNTTEEIQRNKFIAGAIPLWAIAFMCIFVKFEKFLYKVVGMVFFAFLGFVAGYIFQFLPTVIQPICNYILVPILEFILIGILLSSNNTKKEDTDS